MIRVTVELVSAIDPKRSRVLGIAEISNDGQRSILSRGREGSYDVRLSKWAPMLERTWMRGRVERFDRQKLGAWDLLYLALRACVGSRNESRPVKSTGDK